jgi:hypothetical protein
VKPLNGLLALALLAGGVLAAGAAAAVSPALAVKIDRTQVSTRLGDSFVFTSTITNRGPAPVSGLIAHLNILSLKSSTYVDPEDWSTQRTRYLKPIPAGGSVTQRWPMKAVNGGHFAVYLAVLRENGAAKPPTPGPTLRLDVSQRSTLNSGGIVPLALAVPGGLLLLWFGLRLHRRARMAGID